MVSKEAERAANPRAKSPFPLMTDLLNELYPIRREQIVQFRQDGFIHLPGVFDEATLSAYEPILTELTLAHNPAINTPLAKKDLYGRAFIQVGNLWTLHRKAREFLCCRRLAAIAAELMGTNGVRMYHDQALYKEAGGGSTPWHVDQQYWPLASPLSVTAWVPMHAIALDQGPMAFARGSHLRDMGRDLEISAESDAVIGDAVQQLGLQEVVMPYQLGEVSFHAGWTMHRAGENRTDQTRKVQTVIYIDSEMRLAEPRNSNQERDWRSWSPSTRVGEIMDDPLNPVLFEVHPDPAELA